MRLSKDEYFMGLAQLAAQRTTCIRRGVGCVLVDSRGHVLSIGYNGVAAGLAHCNTAIQEPRGYVHSHWVELEGERVEATKPTFFATVYPHACVGHDLPPGQDSCGAAHAEQNALLQCRDPWSIEAAYITLSPCMACTKLLLNTSCKRVIFLEDHVSPTSAAAKELWLSVPGRSWVKHD